MQARITCWLHADAGHRLTAAPDKPVHVLSAAIRGLEEAELDQVAGAGGDKQTDGVQD
jgi:hypothetical protein